MQASLQRFNVVLAELSVKGLVDEGQETLHIDLIQRAVPALTHTHARRHTGLQQSGSVETKMDTLTLTRV